VIFGDLAQLAVPQPERAGIADVNEGGVIANAEHRRQGSPHAAAGGIFGSPAAYLGVGLCYRAAEDLERGRRGHLGVVDTQRLDHRGAGHLAGGVAAHAVSDGVQPAA
jgi:hypothetical protein